MRTSPSVPHGPGAGDEAKIINDEGLIMMVISMQRMYQQGN